LEVTHRIVRKNGIRQLYFLKSYPSRFLLQQTEAIISLCFSALLAFKIHDLLASNMGDSNWAHQQNSSTYLRALLESAMIGVERYDYSCPGTGPKWSQTREFEEFATSRSYDMLTDVHQLKDKLFCLERPGFAVGSFEGTPLKKIGFHLFPVYS
jgi:hypothetical protein